MTMRHIKSGEDEAHNPKTLLKVSENNKLNPKLVDGKNTQSIQDF